MLADLRALTRGDHTFWLFLALSGTSAVLQAGAVLTLLPLLEGLFGPDPGTTWPWLLALLALIAAAWGLDLIGARQGLTLGIRVMRRIQRSAPTAVLSWPPAELTAARTRQLRTLVSQGSNEATSSVVLMIAPIITAFVMTGRVSVR